MIDLLACKQTHKQTQCTHCVAQIGSFPIENNVVASWSQHWYHQLVRELLLICTVWTRKLSQMSWFTCANMLQAGKVRLWRAGDKAAGDTEQSMASKLL